MAASAAASASLCFLANGNRSNFRFGSSARHLKSFPRVSIRSDLDSNVSDMSTNGRWKLSCLITLVLCELWRLNQFWLLLCGDFLVMMLQFSFLDWKATIHLISDIVINFWMSLGWIWFVVINVDYLPCSSERIISPGTWTLPRPQAQSGDHRSWACRHVDCGGAFGPRPWGFHSPPQKSHGRTKRTIK